MIHSASHAGSISAVSGCMHGHIWNSLLFSCFLLQFLFDLNVFPLFPFEHYFFPFANQPHLSIINKVMSYSCQFPRCKSLKSHEQSRGSSLCLFVTLKPTGKFISSCPHALKHHPGVNPFRAASAASLICQHPASKTHTHTHTRGICVLKPYRTIYSFFPCKWFSPFFLM